MMRAEQVDKFVAVYKGELADVVAQYPIEYPWPADMLDKVVERMRHAFYEGTYNYEGRAIRRTCRKFNIPHTRQAMEAFFNKNIN